MNKNIKSTLINYKIYNICNTLLDNIPLLCFIFAFLFSTFCFIEYNSALAPPINEFRQTQTAISAFYLTKNFNLFNYETPILGSPWTIPFEFPTYQALAAIIWKIFPSTSLNSILKSISWAFSMLTCFPLYIIIKNYIKSHKAAISSVTLYIITPLILYWSNSTMIESTVLFLSMSFWALVIQLTQRFSIFLLFLTCLVGTLAIITKVTTGTTFFIAAATHLLLTQYKNFNFIKLLTKTTPFIIAFLVLLWWTHHTDTLKSLGFISQTLTSKKLFQWNFGTLDKKLDINQWLVFFQRMVPDILGNQIIVGIILTALFLLSRRYLICTLLSISLFFITILIFTNLHFAHDYYQFSCSVFLTSALAFSITGLCELQKRKWGILLLPVCITFFISFFYGHFEPNYHTEPKTYIIGSKLKDLLPQETSILIFGSDWSSATHHYAQRRGIACPDWFVNKFLSNQDIIEAPFGKNKLGAVVFYKQNHLSKETINNIFNNEQLKLFFNNCSIFETNDAIVWIKKEIFEKQ